MATETQKGTEETTDGVHRLMGMSVHEVSLVDRAANKRHFLIVKRDEMSEQTQTTETGAPAATKDESGGAGEATAKAGMQAQVKDELLAALTSACERLVTVAQSVKDSEVSDAPVEPAVPTEIVGAIGEVAEMLKGLASQYGAAAAPPATETPAEAAPPGDQAADPAKSGDEVQVGKAGRRMAKERLERFRKALDLLVGIMKEISFEATRKRAPASPPEGDNVMVSKATIAEINAALSTAVEVAQKQETVIADLQKQVADLKKAAPLPRSLPAGDETQVTKSGQVAWPLDMNRPLRAVK